jgi:hypothetical protein
VESIIPSHPPAPGPKGGCTGIRRATLVVLLLVAWMSTACAVPPAATPNPPTPDKAQAAFQNLKSILDQSGDTIDYDTLMQVYQTMVQSPGPIAHTDQLLRRLIDKRNANPRIDQMILIFSARIIGHSRYEIPGAQHIFELILKKKERLNEWVISFVAEAIGDYIYDLPEGDKLVDFMDAQLERVRSRDRSGEEQFGFHFLPPPKSAFIRTYISSITDRRSRQRERNLYYVLIKQQWTEQQIETALKYLQAHGAPDSAEKCPLLMRCLMRYRHSLPFEQANPPGNAQ